MKRFVPEISLGMATAAAILELLAWNAGQFASLFHFMVIAAGLTFCWAGLKRRQAPRALEARGGANPLCDEDVRRLLADGQKIAAIKLHRELHGLTLREAVDAVDAVDAVQGSHIRG